MNELVPTPEGSEDKEKSAVSGVIFFVLLLLVLVFAGFKSYQWLKDEQRLPVQNIVISGERQFVDDDKLRAAVHKALPGSFFDLDVDVAHEVIEARPWVYKASVRKEWPNTLRVYVTEQQAVARWNDDLLLNTHGGSFQAVLPEGQDNLPLLYGPGGSEQTALQGYRAMQSLLGKEGLAIEQMLLSERFAWRLTLVGGLTLNLGRTEFIDRVQRFVDLYPLLTNNERYLDYVDLRYDTGMAVGWKSDLERSKENNDV
ncbi:FtsQ-type POTRA domain-containing protein [Alteromonadaceae bacterium M269]|nr:FtsQ-type POTRA domain-containing protein [Alteromonadaceae bacterium M269]